MVFVDYIQLYSFNYKMFCDQGNNLGVVLSGLTFVVEFLTFIIVYMAHRSALNEDKKST